MGLRQTKALDRMWPLFPDVGGDGLGGKEREGKRCLELILVVDFGNEDSWLH